MWMIKRNSRETKIPNKIVLLGYGNWICLFWELHTNESGLK